MPGQWAGWQRLSWRDRRLMPLYMLGLAIVHAGLALWGYRQTRRAIEVLTRRDTRRDAAPLDLENARALARRVALAGRHGAVNASCLRQSLLIYGCLRRRGLDPRLELGVKPSDGALHAHAWVELGSERLSTGDDGFEPFQRP